MKKTVAEAKKTKRSIMDAGIKVFARDGYRKATLEAIGKEAGLTRGAIYWHFKDKHDLHERIFRQQDDLLDGLVESVLSKSLPPFRKLQTLLETVIDNFYDNETFRQFIELSWYKLDNGQFGRVMDSKSVFVQKFLAIMERLLRESLESGRIKAKTDIRLAAFHLSCLINGFYRLYHVAPDWARDKTRTKQVFRDYFRTLTAGRISKR